MKSSTSFEVIPPGSRISGRVRTLKRPPAPAAPAVDDVAPVSVGGRTVAAAMGGGGGAGFALAVAFSICSCFTRSSNVSSRAPAAAVAGDATVADEFVFDAAGGGGGVAVASADRILIFDFGRSAIELVV